MRDYSGRFVADPLRKGGGFCMTKLLNPFDWIQRTLDNFTSWFSLIRGGEMLAGYWVFGFCVFLLDVLKGTYHKHRAELTHMLHTRIVQR